MGGVLKYRFFRTIGILGLLLSIITNNLWAQKEYSELYSVPREFLRVGQLDSAVKYFQIIINDTDNFHNNYIDYSETGNKYFEIGQYDKALLVFNDILNHITSNEKIVKIKEDKWSRKYRRIWNRRYWRREYKFDPTALIYYRIQRKCNHTHDFELLEKKIRTLNQISNIYKYQGRFSEAKNTLMLFYSNRKCKKHYKGFKMDIYASLVGINAYKQLQEGDIDKSIKIIVQGINKLNKNTYFGKYLLKDLAEVLKFKYPDTISIFQEMDNANIRFKIANKRMQVKYNIELIKLKIDVFDSSIKLNTLKYRHYIDEISDRSFDSKVQNHKTKGINPKSSFYSELRYLLTGEEPEYIVIP
jgi:hypothetical protein